MNNDRGLIGFFGLDEWFDKLTEDEKQKFRDYYFMPQGISISISITPCNKEEDISIIELGDPKEYINRRSPRLTRETFLQTIGNNAITVKDGNFAEKIYHKALETKDINPILRHFIYNNLIDFYYTLRNEEPEALSKCIKYCDDDIKFLNDFLNAYKNGEKLEKEKTIYDYFPAGTLNQDDANRMNEILTPSNNVSALIRDHAEKQIAVKHIRNMAKKIFEEKQPLVVQVAKNMYKTKIDYRTVSNDLNKQADKIEKSLTIIYEKQGKSKIYIPSVERLAIIYEKQGKIKDAIKVCSIGLKYELRDSTKGGFEGRKAKLLTKLEKMEHSAEPAKDFYALERKAYETKKGKPKDEIPKIERPKIPYKSNLLDFDFNINFSLTKNQQTDMDYVNYWNKLVENLFNLINRAADREIAFIGFRKNFPMPIVTTYNRVSKNPEYNTDRVSIHLEVFTDDNCSKFVDEIYKFLTSLKACNEISSIRIKQPWLLSKSKDNIDRTHIETEFKINF